MKLEDKLFVNRFKPDSTPHLKVKDPNTCLKCKNKQCAPCCPTQCYTIDEEGKASVSCEGCVECGTCKIVCNEFNNIEWKYPRGGFGILYKFG